MVSVSQSYISLFVKRIQSSFSSEMRNIRACHYYYYLWTIDEDSDRGVPGRLEERGAAEIAGLLGAQRHLRLHAKLLVTPQLHLGVQHLGESDLY